MKEKENWCAGRGEAERRRELLDVLEGNVEEKEIKREVLQKVFNSYYFKMKLFLSSHLLLSITLLSSLLLSSPLFSSPLPFSPYSPLYLLSLSALIPLSPSPSPPPLLLLSPLPLCRPWNHPLRRPQSAQRNCVKPPMLTLVGEGREEGGREEGGKKESSYFLSLTESSCSLSLIESSFSHRKLFLSQKALSLFLS